MARLICFIVGFVAIELIAHTVGIDKVANEIQVLSAVPWVYALYRLERLHHKHDELRSKINDKENETNGL